MLLVALALEPCVGLPPTVATLGAQKEDQGTGEDNDTDSNVVDIGTHTMKDRLLTNLILFLLSISLVLGSTIYTRRGNEHLLFGLSQQTGSSLHYFVATWSQQVFLTLA